SPGEGDTAQQRFDGPWSLFRLLRATDIMNSNGRDMQLAFDLDGHRARLQLTTDSIHHPFNPSLLEDFRLPATL
ncbi:MAG: hypothetical protein EA349_01720, partial [Halomonadaceae bacterium]